MKIKATIYQEDRQLDISADNLNELIDKIKEWNDWDDWESYFKETGKDKSYIEKEKISGWYFIKSSL